MEVTLSYDGPANAQALIARFSTGTPRVKAAGTEPLVLRLEENGSGEAGDGGAVVAGEGNGLSGAGARVGHQSRGGGTLRSTRPVLTVDTPRVQYSSVAPSNDCRYLVGVVSGGTMRLVDAEYHELRPRIKAVEAIETTRRALNTREEILTAHTQLTQSFGGKAKKAKLSAATQYRTDEASVKPSHQLTDQHLTRADDGGATRDPDASRLVPPFNKEATTAVEAYPRSKIITSPELNHLRGAAEMFWVPRGAEGAARITAWEQDPDYMRTVIEAVRSVHSASGSGSDMDETKLQLVAYLDILIRLFQVIKALPGARRGVYQDRIVKKLENPPKIIADKVIATFTDPGDFEDKRIFSPQRRDCLVSYIIVVFLHVCDFAAVPVACLAKDLSLSAAKVREHCRYVGCTPGGGSGTVQLKVPLAFPERRKRAAPKQ
eukprot:m.80624 g.80624  ORF g.80624 m.80624 type:complete len:433 (-) comp9365_c0_seq2:99-1397(-)